MQYYVSTYSTYECSLCISIHSLFIIGASELYSSTTTILPSFIKTSDSIFEIMFYILSTYFTGTPRLVMIYPGPGSETWVPISLRCGYPGTRVPIFNLKVV